MKKNFYPPKQIRFTKEGYDKINKRYKKLKKERPEAVTTLARARAMGDLSENGFYKAAKGKLLDMDSEIARLEHMIKFALIQKKKKTTVDIGSKVTVLSKKKKIVYKIVGDLEADPRENKISLNSPIGKALSGKKDGDSTTIQIPSGRIIYKIIEIK